jgi:cytosine/creatinine deaminase
VDVTDVPGWAEAHAEAEQALSEGGAPFGAALVRTADGAVIARGHNRHYQDGDPTAHAEIVTLRNAGALRPAEFAATTMVTNAIPCFLCAGAIVQLGIPRVVAGAAEWDGRRTASHDFLVERGIEVIDLQRTEILELMMQFVAEHPDDWQDDLGAAIEGMDLSAVEPDDGS